MHPYPYVMNSVKAIQAVAILLKQANNNAYSYIDILKMLYRADIRSFEETAYPILRSGGELAELVPTLPNSGEWRGHMSVEGEGPEKTLILDEDPGKGELCPYEIDILEETFKEVKNG